MHVPTAGGSQIDIAPNLIGENGNAASLFSGGPQMGRMVDPSAGFFDRHPSTRENGPPLGNWYNIPDGDRVLFNIYSAGVFRGYQARWFMPDETWIVLQDDSFTFTPGITADDIRNHIPSAISIKLTADSRPGLLAYGFISSSVTLPDEPPSGKVLANKFLTLGILACVVFGAFWFIPRTGGAA